MNRAAKARAGHTRWKFAALLIAMSFLSYALRQNMQVAGEQMMPELGISEIQMGWVFAAFVWGYTFFGLPGGLLGERFGVRLTITICGVLWLLGSVLSAVVPSWFLSSGTGLLVALLVMRFLNGAVHAPIFPLVGDAIAAWFPVGRWGFPNSLSSAGCTLGAAATQPLVVWAMVAWGWQSAFYIFIVPGIALCALWWWYARDDPASHPRVGAAELALINADRMAMNAAAREDTGAWKRLLRNRETLLLLGAYSSANFVFYLFFTWFFHYLVKERGFSMLETGFLAMLPWLAAAASAALGGWCCDTLCQRIGPRWGCRLPGAGGLVAAAVFLLAGLHVDDPYAAVAMLSLCFAAEQFTEASFWQAQTFVAPSHAASATGIMNTGANAAGMVVGPLVPWLAAAIGWPAALSSGAFFALLGAALWMFVRSDRPLPAHGT